MKNILLLVAVLFCGFAYSKNIPSPFWYSISQKIILETKDYIINDEKALKEFPKVKPQKTIKSITLPLKCEDKKESSLLTPFITVNKNNIWIKSED